MFKRKRMAFLVAFLIFSITANAFLLPLLGIAGRFVARPLAQGTMWVATRMIQAGGASRWVKSIDLAVSAHATIGYLLWSNSQDPNSETEIPIQVSIAPKSDQAQTNPDSNRYTDASGGSPSGIQPTPKNKFDPKQGFDSVITSYVSTEITSRGENNPTTWRKTDIATKVKRYQYHVTTSISDPSDAATLTSGWIQGYRGYVTISGVSKPIFVEYQEQGVACPSGYKMQSDGSCFMSVTADNIQKPANTVQCEITRTSDGKWNVDSKNPECVSTFSQNITTSSDNKSVTVSDGSGQSVTATDNADGTRDYNFQNGNNWSTVKTGNYDSNSQGRPIISTTSGTGTNPNGTSSGTGGTGTGTGTGTGSGSGSCGGSGQVKCGIDDSGFGDAPTDGSKSVIDGVIDGLGNTLTSHLPSTPTFNFFPSFGGTSCNALVINKGFIHNLSIDWCFYINLIKNGLSFLAYLLTLFGLHSILMRPPASK